MNISANYSSRRNLYLSRSLFYYLYHVYKSIDCMKWLPSSFEPMDYSTKSEAKPHSPKLPVVPPWLGD